MTLEDGIRFEVFKKTRNFLFTEDFLNEKVLSIEINIGTGPEVLHENEVQDNNSVPKGVFLPTENLENS